MNGTSCNPQFLVLSLLLASDRQIRCLGQASPGQSQICRSAPSVCGCLFGQSHLVVL
jgi:hypothetical protein